MTSLVWIYEAFAPDREIAPYSQNEVKVASAITELTQWNRTSVLQIDPSHSAIAFPVLMQRYPSGSQRFSGHCLTFPASSQAALPSRY